MDLHHLIPRYWRRSDGIAVLADIAGHIPQEYSTEAEGWVPLFTADQVDHAVTVALAKERNRLRTDAGEA